MHGVCSQSNKLLPACFPACLLALLTCLLACLLSCLLSFLLSCFLAFLLSCFLAFLLACLHLDPLLSSLELLSHVLLRKGTDTRTHGHTDTRTHRQDCLFLGSLSEQKTSLPVTKTHYLIKFELLISSFLGNS